ncbi:phage virion morphogenesis protein [Motilimonas sp. 1_MG-2023]|uniref:phage virion morphogenesis protein n=1 Tax=Motilimonas sp. 1_MG-2023 TaxID=3062672 RepID=UPI0026E14598|nr:phage virion morphogenesis protein [Motilimonas sp. 1_MG-2023]MDO6525440.1 phage virion morphogenesis protein [Motilimonas sp. 1_MG-2023]
MTTELQPIIDRLDALIANLNTTERRRLAVEIARSLRGSQAKRIRENKSPSGTNFEAKKPQPQLRKRQGNLRMFSKLQRSSWLKSKGSPESASLGFVGFASTIARVHQYGLRDRVNKNGTQYKYPERELLGFAASELETVETIIIRHLAK